MPYIFRCVAENVVGQATTDCYLTVHSSEGTSKPVTTEGQKTVDCGKNSQESDYKKPKINANNHKTTSGTRIEPPQFTNALKPVVAREGEKCTLVAVVTGFPAPNILWVKDGKELETSEQNDIKFDRFTGVCALTIQSAGVVDSGMYSCRASNKAGRSTSTANVVIVRKFFILLFKVCS